jgi:endonuclease/exonuclease/phosphatase family metal-dependent hydrolase
MVYDRESLAGHSLDRGVATLKTRRRGPAVLFVAASLGLGCGAAHNYLEPDAPRHAGGPGNAQPGPEPDGPLRVVTFNVEYARRIAEAIAALRTPPLLGADVVALQEMDAPGTVAVAQALGLNYVYYPSSRHPQTGRDFGNAVLSPWPIEESHKVLLPGRARVSQQARAAVAAVVKVGGRRIAVYSVHLTSPWGMGGGGRARQADAVLADAEKSAHPIIVAGDFNSSGIGKRFRARGFDWPTERVGDSAGPFSFDHVFLRGFSSWPKSIAGVAKAGPRASDHWPVWTFLPRPPA